MAKTYLTNINLKGNQLLNAVIQSSATAPSAYAAGQLYFNTNDSLFYYSTAAGSSNWTPVGVQYVTSVGSNLSVNNGELDLGAKVVITDATQSLSNKTLLGVTVQGNTYFQSSGGAGGQNNYITVDANSGKLYVHSGYGVQVDATGDVVLNPTGAAYVGSASADNEIATVGGTQTLTNKTIGDELHFVNGGTDGFIAGQAGQLVINANNGLSTISDGDTTITTTVGNIVLNPDGNAYIGSASANNRIITVGDIPTLELHLEGTPDQITVGTDTNNGYTQISLPSYINIDNGEFHLRKNEYWDNGTQFGIVTANNYSGNFTITSVNRSLELEAQNGNDVVLNPGSGIVQAIGKELHITKVELHDSGNTNKGVILAHPSDGSLTVAAINQLVLESHSGNISLDSQNGYTYFNNNLSINSSGEIASNSGDITISPDSGNVIINNNLVTNSIISKSDGNNTLSVDAARVDFNVPTTYFGGSGTTAFVRIQDTNGYDTIKINSGLASDESYKGNNTFVNTQVIDINGFIKLSSENNPATGFLFVNAQGGSQSVPALHLESTGDLALRAGADHGQGNIILYTGATSSGTSGNVFIGYNGQNAAGANNQVATLGETEIFSNKTIESSTLGLNVALGADLDANGHHIVNLENPQNNQDAATKYYVDSKVAGLTWKTSVNLLWNDSNATLTGASGTLIIDGHPALTSSSSGYRILITNGANAGIWDYADNGTSWTLTRSSDADTFQKLVHATVFVAEGTSYAATSWTQNNDYLTDFTGQTWVQFAGQGVYLAGNGIDISGQTISVKLDSDSLSESPSGLKVNLNTGGAILNDSGLYVNTGTGLTINGSNQLIVDETVIATRTYADGAASAAQTAAETYADNAIAALSYTGTITGNASTTSFPITHNLGSRAVAVRIYQTSVGPDTQYAEVETDVVHTSTNVITIGFASAPDNTTTYEVVVIK
jgi:hypothetical protein